MIYYVDFDGTICPNDTTLPPQPECLEVLNRLRECNNEIYIYSCRANAKCVYDKESAIRDMLDYLIKYNVPFDDIIHNKPYFNFYIDDRNVGTPLDDNYCVDWKKIKEALEKSL